MLFFDGLVLVCKLCEIQFFSSNRLLDGLYFVRFNFKATDFTTLLLGRPLRLFTSSKYTSFCLCCRINSRERMVVAIISLPSLSKTVRFGK